MAHGELTTTLGQPHEISHQYHRSPDRLEACLAVDMVVAWRIYHLTKLGREVPDLPADVFFDEDECKVLVAYRNKSQSKIKRNKQVPSAQAMTLYEAIRLIAQIGGFVGRKASRENNLINFSFVAARACSSSCHGICPI